MRSLSLLLMVAIAAFVCGCGLEQRHGYVQSSDGSLSLRHPRQWAEVDLVPAGVEWVVGVDGAADPSATHAVDLVQDAPFVVAQVVPMDADMHDRWSLEVLRALATHDRRDPTTGDDPDMRLLFHRQIVDEHGFEGHHLRFEVDLPSGTATVEHLAVFDRERTRIHRLRVTCSAECFEANEAAIEDIFDSVRFRE